MVFALVHIVGALALAGCLYYSTLILGSKWAERVERRTYDDFSIALGVPVSALKRGKHAAEFVGHLSERYSNDLLSNRLSDLWDTALLVYDLLCHLVLVVAAGALLWAIAVDGREWAKGMWAVPAVFVAFKCLEAVMTAMCMALTGRYPGEAKLWRKALASAIEVAPGGINSSAADRADDAIPWRS